MTHRADVAGSRDIVARWCNLAEQRLEYLTELFETGRWRRYHSERAFLENIQEAKAAVEAWRDLVTREASLDNSAIDFSWLKGARTPLPRGDGFRQPLQRPHAQPLRVAPMAVEPERDIPGDNSVVDFSWLTGARSTLPRGDGFRQPLQRPHTQPAPVAVEPERDISGEIPGDVLVALESQLVASYNTPSVPDAPGLDEMPLAHDPEKWAPVFRKDHAQIKEIERDDDSKKSHLALAALDLDVMQERYPLLRNAL